MLCAGTRRERPAAEAANSVLEFFKLAGFDVPPAGCREAISKTTIVGNEQDGALELLQCKFDLFDGFEIEVIGRLVEYERVHGFGSERTTRYTILVHLPREPGYRHKHRTKNGPALAGYGAITMKNALARSMSALPEQFRRSLTWDRGKELSAHAQFTTETGIPVFFADPRSPWQRGTNENTNGLLRQYFPKGTDLSRWSASDLEAVAHTLNTRPRKVLGWKTPTEALAEHLGSDQQTSVATTG